MRLVAFMCHIAIAGCYAAGAREDAPGLYEMHGSAITDRLELDPNGEFRHDVRTFNGEVLHETGKWEWEEENREKSLVSMNGYTTMVPGMESFGLWPATIEKRCGTVRLVVSRDLGVFYYKRN